MLLKGEALLRNLKVTLVAGLPMFISESTSTNVTLPSHSGYSHCITQATTMSYKAKILAYMLSRHYRKLDRLIVYIHH